MLNAYREDKLLTSFLAPTTPASLWVRRWPSARVELNCVKSVFLFSFLGRSEMADKLGLK